MKVAISEMQRKLDEKRSEYIEALMKMYHVKKGKRPHETVVAGMTLPDDAFNKTESDKNNDNDNDSKRINDQKMIQMAAIMGHITHLTLLSARCLEVQLPYPMHFRMSHSTIADEQRKYLLNPDIREGGDPVLFRKAISLVSANVQRVCLAGRVDSQHLKRLQPLHNLSLLVTANASVTPITFIGMQSESTLTAQQLLSSASKDTLKRQRSLPSDLAHVSDHPVTTINTRGIDINRIRNVCGSNSNDAEKKQDKTAQQHQQNRQAFGGDSLNDTWHILCPSRA